ATAQNWHKRSNTDSQRTRLKGLDCKSLMAMKGRIDSESAGFGLLLKSRSEARELYIYQIRIQANGTWCSIKQLAGIGLPHPLQRDSGFQKSLFQKQLPV